MSGFLPDGKLDSASLERLLDITRRLAMPVSLDEMLAEVIDVACEIMQADRGSVFLYDAKADELWSKVATGTGEIRFPASQGIAGECARTRSILSIPDCYADARFNQEIDRRIGYRTRCLLSVPLIGIDDDLVGVMQMLNKHDGVFGVRDELVATSLGAQCAVALQRATLIQERLKKQRLESELEVARDIQRRVFPDVMPVHEGYEFAGWSRPAEETGGDVYDAFALDEHRVMLLLGDATGHGVGPAISVTQVRAMIRMAVRIGADLDQMMANVNDQLASDLAGNRFVTAFLGVLDTRTHQVTYHAAGQTPLLVIRADGRREELSASTMPLGVIEGIPLDPPDPIVLAPGDLLALISDGIYEAADADDNEFGEERTGDLLRANQQLSLTEQSTRLVQEVEKHKRGHHQEDDMTILLVKRSR